MNTYSVRIFLDGALVATLPYQYGYGDQLLQMALDLTDTRQRTRSTARDTSREVLHGTYSEKGRERSIRYEYQRELEAARNHRRNIDREMEVLKNVVRELCQKTAELCPGPNWITLKNECLKLRDDLDEIFPTRSKENGRAKS
jgi:hypothetical protein